ncbi:MAG TPA: O-antigen ligase family protein [Bradyrhizobium sp.]|nr:O-antigen ligase family protein [Bradyrhizobium sp.]
MSKAIIDILPRLNTRTGIAQWLLVFAFLANVIILFRGQSYEDNYLIDEVARTAQLASLGLLSLSIIFCSDLRLARNKTFVLVIVPFTAYLFINTAVSITPDISSQYVILFFLTTTVICILDLGADDWLRVFRVASLCLSAALLLFILTKTREGRFWGAVHPNRMGTWLFVTAMLAHAWKNWFRWAVVCLTLYVGVRVDSRFSVLGIASFIVVSTCLGYAQSPRKALLQILAIVIIGLSAWNVVTHFFVGQGDRSLEGGGISGRDVLWEEAFERISHHVLLGSGFRSSTTTEAISESGVDAAHSGWIAAADELGMIGLAAFVAIYVWKGCELLNWIRNTKDPSSQRLYSISLAGLVANVVPLTFQPNYINFGDPLGLFIMLVLFSRIKSSRQIVSTTRSQVPTLPSRPTRRPLTS